MSKESRISRILKINDILGKSAESNYSLRIEKSGTNDEIDKLTDAVNQMLEKIDEENRSKRDTKPEQSSSISEKNMLQSLIDSLEYGLTIQDRNYNIIFQNEYLIKVYGYSRGKCYRTYEFRENVCEGCPVKMSFEDNVSHTTERPVLMPSGKTIIWENTATPIKDADGNITACLEVVRDITDRVKSVELLKVKEKQMSDIISASPVGMAIYDGTGQCVIANDSMAKIIGTTKEQILNNNYNNIDSWEKSGFIESVRMAINTQSVIRQEIIGISSYGKKIFADCQIVPFEKDSLLIMFHDIEEQKQTEEELQKTNDLLRAIIKAAPVAIIDLDQEGKVKSVWNPAAEKMLGWSAEEAIGNYLPSVPIDKEDEFRKFRDWIRSGKTINGVEVLRKKRDGTPIDYSIYASPIHDKDGQITGNIAVMVDITERKRTETALKNSEEKYRAVVESSLVGVYIIQDGLFRFVNDRWYDMYGYTREEIIDKLGPVGLTPLEGKNIVEENLRRRLSGEINEIEYITKGIRKDGKIIDIRVFGSVMEYNGRPAVSGTVIDITEQTRTLEALRESEAKMRGIVDNIGIGVALISPEMEIMELNHRMREWFPDVDTDKRPVCYRAFNSPPRESECEYCPTQKTMQDGMVHEATTQTPSGTATRNFRIISSPLFNAKGEISAVIELVEDITEQLSLEAQLRQSQKMEAIGRLAGGVAHDFNNMLNVILGYTELSLDDLDQSHTVYPNLKEIYNAAVRSADIVRQLLAFARKQTYAPKVLDLNITVEKMFKILQRMIGEDINIALRTYPDIWPVKMDPVQIEQILTNLCVNARDAIAGVGKITIETENAVFDELYCGNHPECKAGEYTMLAVSDSGSGIEKDTIDKIFEPFFSTKKTGKGTGLGLATVFGIVKQNNGFINVYSELNKGTTFKIYIPRHIGQIDENPVKSTSELPVSRGETILVVEDEPMILKIASIMLESQNYRVLTASTPGEALRLAGEHAGDIHLLITDVILPEMNCKDLTKEIKKIRPGIKCLYMSGYTANVIAHRGMLDDGVNFIHKPFSIQSLTIKVREALDKE